MAWKSKGKGSTASFLETALDNAVVSALGLADFGEKRAGGKKGKASSKGAASHECFTCGWKDCKAGRLGHATWDLDQCHCRGRPKAQATNPPVESQSLRAFEATKRSENEKAQKTKGAAVKGGKGAAAKGGRSQRKGKGPAGGKGKATGTKTEKETAEDLAKVRAERLQELRKIKGGAVETAAADGARQPTALQEVAKVFTPEEAALGPQKAKLDEELVKSAEQLSLRAKEVVDSLQGECYPAKKPLLSAEETLTKLLQSVASCASVECREAAEKALGATTQAMTAPEAAGTAATDPDMAALQ